MPLVWFARPDCRLLFMFSEIFEQRTEALLPFTNNKRPVVCVAQCCCQALRDYPFFTRVSSNTEVTTSNLCHAGTSGTHAALFVGAQAAPLTLMPSIDRIR